MPTLPTMDRERFLTDRLRWRAQTLAYVGGSAALLLLATWIVFGFSGALWLLIAAGLVLGLQGQMPLAAVLRMRGARPLAPYEAPELHALLVELSRRAGLPRAPALYFVARSHPEAFTVAAGGDSAVAVSRGLLGLLSRDELAGVLAHEISHVRAGDTRLLGVAFAMQRLTGNVVVFGLLAVLLSVFGLFPAVSPLAPLLLVMPQLSTAAAMAVSRTREFDADLGAAALVGDPRPLARALQKLDHLHRGVLGMLGVRLEALVPRALNTHPPTAERVERLLALLPARRAAAELVRWPRRIVVS